MADKNYSPDELDRYFSDPEARQTGKGDPGKRLLKGVLILIGGVAACMVLLLVILSFSLPSIEHIENPEYLESTVVYTSDGVELARYYLGQNRTWVSNEEIADVMKDALVSVEDRRFFSHWGVDVRGFLAAFRDAVVSGGETGHA